MQNKPAKFQVLSKLGKLIRITEAHWERITTVKHPIVKNRENEVIETLSKPDEIRQSKTDTHVYLYYKKFDENFMAVVCKHLNGEGFIVTTYITDSIKEGNLIWKK